MKPVYSMEEGVRTQINMGQRPGELGPDAPKNF